VKQPEYSAHDVIHNIACRSRINKHQEAYMKHVQIVAVATSVALVMVGAAMAQRGTGDALRAPLDYEAPITPNKKLCAPMISLKLLINSRNLSPVDKSIIANKMAPCRISE
jgi:hypothetical protein